MTLRRRAGWGLGIVVLAGLVVAGARRDRQPPTGGSRQAAPFANRTKGSPTAPITVYEIADFQCPACRAFWAQTLPTLEREYVATGKVRMIFVNLPLQELHRNARVAHRFAMCAADQGKFWPIHDRLFGEQEAWGPLADPRPAFVAMADAAGLARGRLDSCLADDRMDAVVEQERAGVMQAGITSTPSFIIQAGTDRGLLPGAAPIDTWRPILDSLLGAH